MKTILSTIVGSRLHGTASPESDHDYRGVFLAPIEDLLSPFRTPKESSWILGELDNTSYELKHFCKMCSQGNPSALEVLVGIPHEVTPEGEALRRLLPKFISRQRCFDAFMGYSRNQEKKFRDNYQGRKHKYATAHVRTLHQLLHLLRTGELVGTYPEDVVEELRQIKYGKMEDKEIFSRVFDLEQLCRKELETCDLPENPDTAAIEQFVVDTYLAQQAELCGCGEPATSTDSGVRKCGTCLTLGQ